MSQRYEELVPLDVEKLNREDLLQTKMYGWLPDWFKHGDSFFGVHPEVKERLNHPEQARRGMYAKLEELKKMEEFNSGYRSERSDEGSALTGGGKGEAGSELKFYQRFREKVEEQQAKAAKAIAKPDLEVKQKIPPCYEGKYQPGLHDVCGPPLRWFMPWATFGHLLATIVVPLLAVTWSQCEGEHEMLAKYPGWLWLPFFVWVAFMMLMEWKCFTYIVVPLVGMSGPKRVLNLNTNFYLWTAFIVSMSLVTQSEVWSQGLLVASAVRASLECQGWKETLAPAWSKAWNDSLWGGFEAGKNLLILAGLAWGVLVLQLIVYLLRAVPLKWFQCGKVEYTCGSENKGYTVPAFCMRIWHADAIKTLASLNRMVLVQDGQTEYAINRAYFKLISDPQQSAFDFFHILKMDMRFALFDAFFVNLLQNSAKLQFQTSYCALLLYAHLEANVRWTWLTLALTHFTSALSLYRKSLEWLKVRDSRMMVREECRKEGKGMDYATWREYDKLVFFQRSVALVLMLQFLFQLFCAIKFCMSQWHCESHLWNLAGGCVEGLPVVNA